MAPPPSTSSERGTVFVAIASRLVQNGTSDRPGTGGIVGRVPVARTTPRATRTSVVLPSAATTSTRPGPVSRPTPQQVAALSCESVGRDGVVPVVGRLVADPLRDGGEVRRDRRRSGRRPGARAGSR